MNFKQKPHKNKRLEHFCFAHTNKRQILCVFFLYLNFIFHFSYRLLLH
uniref:Uncharacterized protein n=1 Tax=Rhizophora mucronata TaxID=61149 RepID=A0A2P2NCX1_RHIMU